MSYTFWATYREASPIFSPLTVFCPTKTSLLGPLFPGTLLPHDDALFTEIDFQLQAVIERPVRGDRKRLLPATRTRVRSPSCRVRAPSRVLLPRPAPPKDDQDDNRHDAHRSRKYPADDLGRP
jgi:hypothetical protein